MFTSNEDSPDGRMSPRTTAARYDKGSLFGAANRMKVLMQHVQEEPMPPSHRTELQIPREVDEFVLACLRKDPERRPASAEELVQMATTCKIADLWDQREARK